MGYTRCRGFKLLSKMGYKAGAGLGRQEQGPVNPLGIHKRTARAGLGVDEAKREREKLQIEIALQQGECSGLTARQWSVEGCRQAHSWPV